MVDFNVLFFCTNARDTYGILKDIVRISFKFFVLFFGVWCLQYHTISQISPALAFSSVLLLGNSNADGLFSPNVQTSTHPKRIGYSCSITIIIHA